MKYLFLLLLVSFNSIANQWMNFEWAEQTVEDIKLEKSAILITVNDGQQLQLDTGAPSSYLYAPNFQFKGELQHTFTTSNNVTIDERFKVHDSMSTKGKIIGTLGASYFKNAMLIIDFPNQRLMKAKSLPKSIPRNAITYIDGNLTKDMHLVTTVNVGEKTLSPVLFDTGSSIFKLVLNKSHWLEVVNESDTSSPPLTMKVPAWGRSITLFGAKSKAPICLGKICVEGNVYYSDDPQLNFAKIGLAGLMGNAILENSYVLVLDYINQRVGTIKQ